MRNCFVTTLLVAGVTLAAAVDAWAVTAIHEPATPLVGGQGKVVIGERPMPVNSNTLNVGSNLIFSLGGVEYLVDVLDSTTQVHAFAVSGNDFTKPGNFMPGWQSWLLSVSDWEDGFLFNIGGNTYNTSNYVPFSSLFGNDDYVYLYNRGQTGSPIVDGEDQNQGANFWTDQFAMFYRGGDFDSEFIVFGGSGELIEASFAAVPEPSSFALAAMSLAGLAAFRRKRK